MSLEKRIGVSTLWMPCNGETLWEAIDRAYEAGFHSIEVIPADYQGNSGSTRTRPSVGLNLDEFGADDRDRLAKSLQRFDYRYIHSLHRDLNIASRNQGIARESVRQYLQCAQLAVDTGCTMATFHPGIPDRSEQIGDEAYVIQRNIDFGSQMADFAEKHELKIGFENLGGFPTPDQMQQILDSIGSQRVGFHFDVGHSWLAEPRDPFAWLPRFAERLVSVHMHGTYHRPDRDYENHQSLEMDDCTDLPRLMRLIGESDYAGPINLEIISSNLTDYLAACQRSKDMMMAL